MADETGELPTAAPVVKLFVPWGAATWLVCELDPETNVAFGLADLGFGSPELGHFSIDEISQIRGPVGLRIERDAHFRHDTDKDSILDYSDGYRIVA